MTTIQPPSKPIDAPVHRSAVRQWIMDHDDRWLFVGAYITLAVVLSIWISLFWLVAVVAGHGVLEWIRHRHFDAEPRGVVVRVLWELKLDIALVLFALAVGVYMEFILGVAGLSGVARTGLAGGTRFAGWQKVIRGVLLSVDDAAQLGRAVAGRGGSDDDAAPDQLQLSSRWGGWTQPWAMGDWLSLALGILSVSLIITSPMLTDHTWASLFDTILQELHPRPT